MSPLLRAMSDGESVGSYVVEMMSPDPPKPSEDGSPSAVLATSVVLPPIWEPERVIALPSDEDVDLMLVFENVGRASGPRR